MNRALFIASQANNVLLQKQAVISNNLANVDSIGFKEVFDSVNSELVMNKDANWSTGRVYPIFQQYYPNLKVGVLKSTSNPLDISLDKQQFLRVLDANGNEFFTKRGDLKVSSDGVLKINDQYRPQGPEGDILLNPQFKYQIANDGSVVGIDPNNAQNREVIGNLQIVSVSSEQQRALLPVEGGVFKYNKGSLEDLVVLEPEQIKVNPQTLEQSNVSISQVMIEMIEQARKLDVNTKLISTLVANEQKANDVLGSYQ